MVDGLLLSVGSTTTDHDLRIVEGAPPARLSKDDIAWLGGVRLGMSRSAVEEFLKSKALIASAGHQGLMVQAEGHHALVNSTLGMWIVQLNFETNILTKLSIETDIAGASAGPGPK